MEENCELSDQNSHDLDIENPSFYDNSERYDYYQREADLGRAAARLSVPLQRRLAAAVVALLRCQLTAMQR